MLLKALAISIKLTKVECKSVFESNLRRARVCIKLTKVECKLKASSKLCLRCIVLN